MATIMTPRGLLHTGLLCLCCASCSWSESSGAAAFVSPLARLRGLSCSAEMARRGARKRAVVSLPRRHEVCSMLSSDTTRTNELLKQGSRERAPRANNADFVVYTGPAAEAPGRKISPQQQARKEREQLLGRMIQRSAQLHKLKKQLAEQSGTECVTDDVWAEAAGETEESLRRVVDAGASAKQALVEMNLGVVHNIVEGYLHSIKRGVRGNGGRSGHAIFAKTDLVQEATMGLICAVERFDPARGFRFATYAQWWVRKYLNECLQNQNRMIRIPVTLANRISKVNRLKDKLQLELGRAPTNEELATAAGCTLDQLKACLEQGAVSVSSLDHLSGFGRVKSGGGSGLRKEGCVADEGNFFPRLEMQMLPQAKALPQGQGQAQLGWDSREGGAMAMVDQGTEAEFMQISLREDLRYALFRLLDATERQCLVLRYGLQDGAPKSVEETAEIMEFCDPDDVRIITRQAMVKLREGCLPKEKEKLMSYLSRYEPETLTGPKAAGNRRERPNSGECATRTRHSNISSSNSRDSGRVISSSDGDGVSGELGTVSDAGADEKGDGDGHGCNKQGVERGEGEDDEEDDVVWDFSNHGQKELQAELNRYLKRLRLEKEKKENEGTKWSKRALAKGGSRRKRNGTSSKYQQEAARRREERLRKLEHDREEKELQRKREAEWERERMLRPMRVGSGAGSAVIGDLEPKPNSREASQLEHLSRLLWDGEEEPADFALSYGQRSDPPSI